MRSDLLWKEGSSGRSCESLYLDLCAPAAGPECRGDPILIAPLRRRYPPNDKSSKGSMQRLRSRASVLYDEGGQQALLAIGLCL
jgi:hypothetical protein